jgi:metallo-beta-lactamase family protein
MATLQFLGAAGTVTGSRFLLEHQGRRVLVDCGLFQGRKEWRLRNWEKWPVPADSIDAVVLTHAHIDHSGGLPRLVKEGFSGPVYCTPGTADLCGLLLPDSAQLQEEEARFANKERYSRHSPALPLYTAQDAQRALTRFRKLRYDEPQEILEGLTLQLSRAGHILGSAVVSLELASTRQRVVFTGDLGRYNAPILRDPQGVAHATTLVAESTYGNREHGSADPSDVLAEIVNRTFERGGMLVIPAFAVGRTQDILYRLRRLEDQGKVPVQDVYVDSPMACDATPLYLAHPDDHDLVMGSLIEQGRTPLSTARTRFVTAVNDSKRLNALRGPGIIISASGMATGGRILHHLAQRLPGEQNTVLFVGYQPEGTRGRRLLQGEKELKMHGRFVPVRAEVKQISGFSAHADWKEMLRWMQGLQTPPLQTLLVHGEPAALDGMRAKVAERGWMAHVPEYLETVELAAGLG